MWRVADTWTSVDVREPKELCSTVHMQGKSSCGALPTEGSAPAWQQSEICGLGGIPESLGLSCRIEKKLPCKCNRAEDHSFNPHPAMLPCKRRVFPAVEPVLPKWCLWNQRWRARQVVPAIGGNSRNLHPTNSNAAFFQRWSASTFALEEASDQHPDKLASSYSGAESCFNAFQLLPQISNAACRSHVRMVVSSS